VHDIVCDFVAAQAEADTEASGGWAGYREVFLSAEVQDLISARLEERAAAAASASEESASDWARSPKKRKLEADAVPPPPTAVRTRRRGLVEGLLLGRDELLGRGARGHPRDRDEARDRRAARGAALRDGALRGG
jgi:hypothetical protein